MKTYSFLGLAVTVGLWANVASAEPMGRAGQLVIGAERLVGIQAESLKQEGNDSSDSTTSVTTISLLGKGSTLIDSGRSGPAAVPRLSFDGFVTDGLSLGGALVYWRSSGSAEPNGAGDSADLATLSTFQIAPRIGYAWAMSDAWSFWPRLGIEYTNYSISDEESDSSSSLSFLEASVEALFAVSPVPHFAFVFGPYLELPMTSSVSYDGPGSTDPDVDLSYLSYGVTAGIAGVF
jgi:hypothetical protein